MDSGESTGFYSPAAHVRLPRLDYESHATGGRFLSRGDWRAVQPLHPHRASGHGGASTSVQRGKRRMGGGTSSSWNAIKPAPLVRPSKRPAGPVQQARAAMLR